MDEAALEDTGFTQSNFAEADEVAALLAGLGHGGNTDTIVARVTGAV